MKSKLNKKIMKLRHELAINNNNYNDKEQNSNTIQESNLLQKFESIFHAVTESMKTLISCDRATLWFADYENEQGPLLWSKVYKHKPGESNETMLIKCRLEEGIVGECVSADKTLNIPEKP